MIEQSADDQHISNAYLAAQHAEFEKWKREEAPYSELAHKWLRVNQPDIHNIHYRSFRSSIHMKWYSEAVDTDTGEEELPLMITIPMMAELLAGKNAKNVFNRYTKNNRSGE